MALTRLAFVAVFLLSGIAMMYCNQTQEIKVVEPHNRYMHFSLDDVRDCTTRLSTTDYNSVFEDSTLAILNDWHKKYGIVVSLYVQGNFEINSKYAKELVDNSSWLKFGYHGVGDKKFDMWRFYHQVNDSIGSTDVIDQMPRLDYFHANRIICNVLKCYGCKGFLSCDDWSYNSEKRGSNYFLNGEQSNLLDKNNRVISIDDSLYFVKSDFRLEQIQERWGSTKQCLDYYTNNKQAKELVVFSHEWNFTQYLNQADSIFQWAVNNGYKFDFPMKQ